MKIGFVSIAVSGAFEPHEQHSHADYNHVATKLYFSPFPTVERLFNETSAKFGSISAS
jgi:hypothetical protein